jgi:hypothetical protein
MDGGPTITDWITAVASVFAAVGTVGAVWFALWQVRRQERAQTDVHVLHTNEGGTDFLSARIVHRGGPPLRLETTYATDDAGIGFVGGALSGSTELPTVIRHGESAEAHWLLAMYAEDVDDEGWAVLGPYRQIVFEDSLGRTHGADFPVTRVRRRAWPIRRAKRVPYRYLDRAIRDHSQAGSKRLAD